MPHWLGFCRRRPSEKPLLTEDHLKIAKLCRDVYSVEVETEESFVCSADTDTQATVTLDGTRAIVCVRGTDSSQDWKNNLNAGKVPFLTRKHKDRAKKVHVGFFIGHTSVKAKIYNKLNAMVQSGDCQSILFCGHSAGGICNLLAYDYLNTKNLPLEVVTFGSPKMGNKAFAEDFSQKIKATRVVNDRDVVPLVPTSFMGFQHAGRLIHIKRHGAYEGESNRLRRLFWRLRGVFKTDVGVRDHDMSSYIDEIARCLKHVA